MKHIVDALDTIIEVKLQFIGAQQYEKAAKWRDREYEYYKKYGKERISLWRKLNKIKDV